MMQAIHDGLSSLRSTLRRLNWSALLRQHSANSGLVDTGQRCASGDIAYNRPNTNDELYYWLLCDYSYIGRL